MHLEMRQKLLFRMSLPKGIQIWILIRLEIIKKQVIKLLYHYRLYPGIKWDGLLFSIIVI